LSDTGLPKTKQHKQRQNAKQDFIEHILLEIRLTVKLLSTPRRESVAFICMSCCVGAVGLSNSIETRPPAAEL